MRKRPMRRIKTITALATLAGGLAWTAAAQAGFVNEAPTSAPVMAAAAPVSAVASHPIADVSPIAATRKVTQIGFRPSDIELPRGKGRDVALADMLPVIVPRTFTIEFGGVDRNQLVTWSGSLPWDTVLADAIAPLPNVGVTIDWDRRVVTLHSMASLAGTSQPAAQQAPAAPTDGAVPTTTADTFALVGGQSLETQLQAWAKRAGWAISWNTPDDWIVPHDYAFSGSFQDAVQKVFTQLADDGADVRADIWKGNNSVVVDKAGAHE